MKKLVLSSMAISIVAIILITGSKKEQLSKIPGSYKALDMMSYIRAYPMADIPADGYARAYEQHVKLKSTQSDLLKSSEMEWEPMGPLNTAGRALTVAVDPLNPNTVYMGTASGGLWKSDDLGRGQSWEYVSTGFPVLGVSTIAFPPEDNQTIYIGTGEVYNFYSTGTDGAYRSTRGSYGIGILKSEDGGKTWTKSLDWSYQQNHGVWMVKVAPTNPSVLYAATTQGIYKSEDAGSSWNQVSSVIMATDIEIDPRNENRVIASFGNFGTPDKGIYRTVNGGQDWIKTQANDWFNFQGKILLARSESNPDILYASVGNGFGFNDGATWLLRTDDNGRNWTTVNNTDYSRWQGWFSHDIAINPNNPEELIAVGIDIHKSTDGGETITQKTNGGVFLGRPPIDEPDGPPTYSHSDHHFVMYHPDLADVVLYGNDGGLFVSYDGGETVQSANGGLQSTQFYNGFAVSRSDSVLAMGGLQDNSTVIFRGDGAWQRVIGGDGSWSAINQQDNNVIFGSYQNLNILKSIDNGQGFFNAGIGFLPGESPLFIAPYVISDSDPPVMYAGGIYIYKSEDEANSWQATNNATPLNGDPAFCMDVYDADPDILYVGTVGVTDEPRVFSSQDGGKTWLQSNTSLPNRIPNDIVIHPYDPSIAYVCFSGFGTDHLYRTEDFGLTWEPVGNGLPDVPCNALAIDPEDPTVMYLGNDISVYISVDNGFNWEVFDQGAPDAMIVMDLKVDPVNRKLWLASHGNGAYRTDMVSSIVSNEEILADNRITVFPNPASSIVNIESDNSINSLSWELLDMKGARVLRSAERQVDISSLESGQYFFRIRTEDGISTERFVKI